MRAQQSLMSALKGTPGSIALPYGVSVTWKTYMWPIEPISLRYGSIGRGSFVMKTMPSTLRLLRSTLRSDVLETGFRTRQEPSLRRAIIHRGWKAGMSVRRLAQMIIGTRS